MSWGRGSTRASRKLRAKVLRQDPYCTCQGCPACSPQGCDRPSTDDDHTIPVYLGGIEDIANHRGKCGPCHDHKSRREAVDARRKKSPKRAKPQHPSGYPGGG